MPILIDFYLD